MDRSEHVQGPVQFLVNWERDCEFGFGLSARQPEKSGTVTLNKVSSGCELYEGR